MEMHTFNTNSETISYMGIRIMTKESERLLVNRMEMLQGWFRSSLSQLCVYSGLEPQSTNPDPLNCERSLFARLAKVTQTHFLEESSIQQFLPYTTECVLTILHLLLAETCLHLSRGRVSKMVFSLRHKHIA